MPCLAVDIIKYPWIGNDSYEYESYYLSILELALKKSESEYGAYELVRYANPMNQGRAIGSVKHGRHVNIMWTMTSLEREQQLQPIRVPLLMGLGGCRIFIINQGNQALFDKITTESQLQALIAGQGDAWPDTPILRHNGYRVMTGSSYSGVFGMLRKKRFDYFPRALHEPWVEIEMYDDLVVENKFILHYPAPYFFFVKKGDKRLSGRIRFGLNQALADGSFAEIFNSHKVTQSVLKKVDFNRRVIYTLENPLLSEKTQAALKQSEYHSVCHARKKVDLD